MSRRMPVAVLSSVLWAHLVARVAWGQAQPPNQPEEAEKSAKTIQAEEYPGSRLPIFVPSAIDEATASRFMQLLTLSEAQVAAFKSLMQEYARAAAKLFDDGVPQLEAMSVEGGKARDQRLWGAGADWIERLAVEEQHFIGQLRALDNLLLDQVAAMLSPAQMELLDRVRQHRQRDRCVLALMPVIASQFDLARLMEGSCTSDQLADVDELLKQYEMRVTGPMVELDETRRKQVGKSERLTVEMAASKSQEQSQAILAERTKLMTRQAALQRRIADINDEFLPRIAKRLPALAAEQVLNTYRHQAYRAVYPDPLNPDLLLANVLELKSLDDNVRNACSQVVDEFIRARESVNRVMEVEVKNWSERFAAQYSTEGQAEYFAAMRDLRANRWNLDLEVVKQIAQLAGGTLDATNAKNIEAYKDLYATTLRQAEGDDYPRTLRSALMP